MTRSARLLIIPWPNKRSLCGACDGVFAAIGWNAGNGISADLAAAVCLKPAAMDKYKHENSTNMCGPDRPGGLR